MYHLLWHPQTLFLDEQDCAYRRNSAPANRMHASTSPRVSRVLRDNAFVGALHRCLRKHGVHVRALQTAFIPTSRRKNLLECACIGVSCRYIALVLVRLSARQQPRVRMRAAALKALLQSLLPQPTPLAVFSVCLDEWSRTRRLVLRPVVVC